jgi:hypothetical protein
MFQFVYSFTAWRTCGFQTFEIMYRTSIKIHLGVLCEYKFHFSWVNPQEWIAESYGKYIFNIIKNSQTIVQSDCTICIFHHQCTRVPFFSTSSPAVGFIRFVVNVAILIRNSAISLWFQVYFLNDLWYWASFQMLVFYLYIFLASQLFSELLPF